MYLIEQTILQLAPMTEYVYVPFRKLKLTTVLFKIIVAWKVFCLFSAEAATRDIL